MYKRFVFDAVTDRGEVRENNEDCYFIEENIGLFIVADGMGGHNAGEKASRIAKDTASEYIIKEIKNLQKRSDFSRKDLVKKITDILHSALLKSSKAVKMQSFKDPELEGIGTTLVILLLDKNSDGLYIANIGDSRAYLINDSSIKQLTEDHTLAQELINSGKMDEKSAKNSPYKHCLTKHIGSFNDNGITTDSVKYYKWNKSDYLLLCSDGLTVM